jgi:hypothetical protein
MPTVCPLFDVDAESFIGYVSTYRPVGRWRLSTPGVEPSPFLKPTPHPYRTGVGLRIQEQK